MCRWGLDEATSCSLQIQSFSQPPLLPSFPESGADGVMDLRCCSHPLRLNQLLGPADSAFFMYLRIHLPLSFQPIHSLKKIFYLFIFREREKERRREREKHQRVVASRMPLSGDLALNPGLCPGWDSNPRPFGSQAGVPSTEPHQSGPAHLF